MNRVLFAVVGLGVFLSVGSVADAQYFRLGPYGGVSVRGPFGGVDLLPFGAGVRVGTSYGFSGPGFYGPGFYGPGSYRYRSYGPLDYGYRSFRPPYDGYRYGYYPPSVGLYDVAPQLHYPRVPLYTVPVVPLVPGPYAGISPGYRSARDYVYPEPDVVPDYRSARPSYDRSGGSSEEQLRFAAETLKRSLASRPDDADVWLDYLAPQRIIDSIDARQPPESLRDVLASYEGVAGNSELGAIWSTPGFRQTHGLLSSHVRNAERSAADPQEIPPPHPTPAVPIDPSNGEEDEDQEAVPPEPGVVLDEDVSL